MRGFEDKQVQAEATLDDVLVKIDALLESVVKLVEIMTPDTKDVNKPQIEE